MPVKRLNRPPVHNAGEFGHYVSVYQASEAEPWFETMDFRESKIESEWASQVLIGRLEGELTDYRRALEFAAFDACNPGMQSGMSAGEYLEAARKEQG
jgi:hypothetical protein